MCNFRGNKYSNKHKIYDTTQYEYWDHAIVPDMGKYDLPAFIDYIISYSKVDKISILAHSMGSSVVFYGIATNP